MELRREANDDKRTLTYTIQNIVVRVNLNTEIDLDEILNKLENTEYDKKRFPGLFIRINYPKSVVILFKNGKMILTGIKSFDTIQFTLDNLIKNINEKTSKYVIQDEIISDVVNIVVTANLHEPIDLDLAAIMVKNIIFDPEIFPALVYKASEPIKCVFLIFNNGKVVLTGLKNKEEIEPALFHLGKMIKEKRLFLSQKAV